MKYYGATPQEWANLDIMLGLGPDLLPQVSNPNAEISANSSIRDLGKVPSRYDRDGKVVGISKWTSYRATDADIEKWMKNPDYGICIQTREVRALDIDVPDYDKMAEIMDFISGEMHYMGFPTRTRASSAKCLLAFRLPGNMPKRVIKIREKVICLATGETLEPAWLIEFLASGQQFVAHGTHSSGSRLEWEWWSHEDFPTLGLDEFERLWAKLVDKFAIEASTVGSVRKRGEHFDSEDHVANQITDKGLMLGVGNDGQLFVECPWKGDHSSDSGITETAYFPRGTRGYEQGHFKCMHAGCSKYDDTDFEESLGLRDDMFEAMEVAEEHKQQELAEMQTLRRELDFNQFGQVKATIPNLYSVLISPKASGEYIRHDTFTDKLMFAPFCTSTSWSRFTDKDYTRLRNRFESTGFAPIGKEMIRDVIHLVADLNKFDTALEWLNGLKWDGVPRVADFFANYFGSEDSDYTTAVSNYLWSALAGRVIEPGVKADMVPVLIGKQGIGKSRGVASLVPSLEHYESINLTDRDGDIARRMRGRLVIEIGELRGLHSRDMESVKEFITRTQETWVPKYQEFAVSYARRSVFIGTTNQEEFLADTTGNRRWLPLYVGIQSAVQYDAIVSDRLQLWAEAAELFKRVGILYSDAERLGKMVHDHHRISDVWADKIQNWLHETDSVSGDKPIMRSFLRTREIFEEALMLDVKNIKRAEEMRIGGIMRELGFKSKKQTVDSKWLNTWVKL